MKNRFWMDCETVIEALNEPETEMSLFARLKLDIHLLFCDTCAAEFEKLRNLEEILKTDFFPPAPDFEESVMECLYRESGMEENTEEIPAGFSFRSWVIIGSFMLLSLASAFFGINFIEIADTEGLSFLLPVGLTIGMVVTCYGALFIGGHLKKLSLRFRIR
jgi:hypothetical protein